MNRTTKTFFKLLKQSVTDTLSNEIVQGVLKGISIVFCIVGAFAGIIFGSVYLAEVKDWNPVVAGLTVIFGMLLTTVIPVWFVKIYIRTKEQIKHENEVIMTSIRAGTPPTNKGVSPKYYI